MPNAVNEFVGKDKSVAVLEGIRKDKARVCPSKRKYELHPNDACAQGELYIANTPVPLILT